MQLPIGIASEALISMQQHILFRIWSARMSNGYNIVLKLSCYLL